MSIPQLMPARARAPRQRQRQLRVGAGAGTPGLPSIPNPQQYLNNLKQSYVQQGTDFVLDETVATTGLPAASVLQIASDVQAGQYGQAYADMTFALMATYGGPIGAVLAGVFSAWEQYAIGDASLPPCTIPGCESTFGIGACAQGNPFPWASIAQTLVPEALPASLYKFNGAPNYGPDNLIDWGSYDWQTTLLQENTPWDQAGGPGSFEEMLEQAVMQGWDQQVSAPTICTTLKQVGSSGDIGGCPNGNCAGSQALKGAIFQMATVNAGMIIPVLVKLWNQTHSSTTYGTPQRKLSYPVGGGLGWEDPLQVAFNGLALASGIPEGSTVSVMLNTGVPISSITAKPSSPPSSVPITAKPTTPVKITAKPASPTKPAAGSLGADLAIGAGVLAAAALAGTGVYAYVKHERYSDVWKNVWNSTGGRVKRLHIGGRR